MRAERTGDAGRRPAPILFAGFPMTWQTDCEFFHRPAKLPRAAPFADYAQCSLRIDHANPGEQGCPASCEDLGKQRSRGAQDRNLPGIPAQLQQAIERAVQQCRRRQNSDLTAREDFARC